MKTILVTGSSSGIGKSTCELFSKNHKVIALARTVGCFKKNKNITEIKCDLSSNEDIDNIAQYIKHNNIKINYLVNNAGTIDPIGKFSNVTPKQFEYAFDLNVKAPFFLVQKLIPFMKNNNARVLNISSGAATTPIQSWTVYCMTKSSLIMMSRCMQNDLKEFEILVASMKPGVVDTRMQEYIRSQSENDMPNVQTFRDLKDNNKLKSPELVAEYIQYLLEQTSNDQYNHPEHDINQYAK